MKSNNPQPRPHYSKRQGRIILNRQFVYANQDATYHGVEWVTRGVLHKAPMVQGGTMCAIMTGSAIADCKSVRWSEPHTTKHGTHDI